MTDLPLELDLALPEGRTFTAGQYDLLTIDKPEKKRASPFAPMVEELRVVFPYSGERLLYTVAGKLYGSGVGQNSLRLALVKLCAIPGWLSFVQKMCVNPITMVTRIQQAAAMSEHELHPTTGEQIMLEMKARRYRNLQVEQELIAFLQFVHTPSPIMKRAIKTTAEQVMNAGYRAHPVLGAHMIHDAIATLSKDAGWIKRQQDGCRVPKDTGTRLMQVVARLSSLEAVEEWKPTDSTYEVRVKPTQGE